MKYRTVFISDIHLGMRWSKAAELSSFLSRVQCEKLYIVGDLFDSWKQRCRARLPESHRGVLDAVTRMAKKIRVCYVTGNHDDFMDRFDGFRLGGVSVCRKTSHTTADERRFLVIHGDEFDVVTRYRKWLESLGDAAYMLALYVNQGMNRIRSSLGMSYWSLSSYLKQRVKSIVAKAGDFEKNLASEVRRIGHHGVICGHIHRPAIRYLGDVLYCNTGDWVESCSVLVEHNDGTMEILRWRDGRLHGEIRERAVRVDFSLDNWLSGEAAG